MSQLSEIVTRLRARKEFFLNGGVWLMSNGPDRDCMDAAKEIEHLRAVIRWVADERWNEDADLDDICTRCERALTLNG